MTEAAGIIKLIGIYGVSTVLLVIILLWIKPKLDDLWKLFIGRASRTLEEDQDKNLREILESENEINLILKEALLEHKANRIAVWQFHNGLRSISGIPFMRLSVTQEQSNIPPLMGLFQNIPISLYSNIISELLIKDYLILDIDTAEHETMKLVMKDTGVHTKVYLPIKDYKNKLYGALSIAWCKEKEFTNSELEKFADVATRVSMVLEIMGKDIYSTDRRNYLYKRD